MHFKTLLNQFLIENLWILSEIDSLSPQRVTPQIVVGFSFSPSLCKCGDVMVWSTKQAPIGSDAGLEVSAAGVRTSASCAGASSRVAHTALPSLHNDLAVSQRSPAGALSPETTARCLLYTHTHTCLSFIIHLSIVLNKDTLTIIITNYNMINLFPHICKCSMCEGLSGSNRNHFLSLFVCFSTFVSQQRVERRRVGITGWVTAGFELALTTMPWLQRQLFRQRRMCGSFFNETTLSLHQKHLSTLPSGKALPSQLH